MEKKNDHLKPSNFLLVPIHSLQSGVIMSGTYFDECECFKTPDWEMHQNYNSVNKTPFLHST